MILSWSATEGRFSPMGQKINQDVEQYKITYMDSDSFGPKN